MVNRRNRNLIVTAAAVAALCAQAGADTFAFSANINGAQEVPASTSLALGFLAGVYDSDVQSFSFSWLITDNLTGTPSAPGAHIHMGAVGVAGPILFGFSSGSWNLSGSALWENMTTSEVDALFAGDLYVNFHTDAFPSGEVRGQITRVVPTPGTLGLVGVGMLMCGTRRRR